MKVLRKNGEIAEVNFEEQEGKKVFWHTSAHVLAQAVKRLYPETKCAVGSATENGFYYEIELSTRPEHSIGSDEEWQLATEALEQAVQGMGKSYAVKEGDGAFYGPKLDFHLKDSLGRTWQCGTIQLDFQLPQRFEIDYIGADGKRHRPIMLHRVVFGSTERFIGILLEHYAGKFPAWIAPVQVKVLPVSDHYNAYAREVAEALEEQDIRTEVDVRKEKLGYKIREARMDKVPYMIIVGENEKNHQSVSVRQRDAKADQQELGEMRLEDMVDFVKRAGRA